MQPTTEQLHALELYRTGEDLVIEAAAGSGKTTTLQQLANTDRSRKGYFLAFNRSVRIDAEPKFQGTGTRALTFHRLAYSQTPQALKDRLKGPKHIASKVFREAIGINTGFKFRPQDGAIVDWVSAYSIQLAVKRTVTTFMRSPDQDVSLEHVRLPNTITAKPIALKQLKELVLMYAITYWRDLVSPSGKLPFNHDVYLKLYQLSQPKLDVDFVMLDEAQDANPLMIAILENQDCQRILVGDRAQAIYEWRGAQNSMDTFPNANRAQLTQSWRFGPRIAEVAQDWLDLLHINMNIRGNPAKTSRISKVAAHESQAIITRTNAGGIREAANQLTMNRKVYIAGETKVEDLKKLAQIAIQLRENGYTSHSEFSSFKRWEQVVDFSETDDGKEYAPLIAAVDEHGAEKLVSMLTACANPNADVTISTAHVAKGLEWDSVKVADDFFIPKPTAYKEEYELAAEEARIGYVTVTRARSLLDQGPLDWANKPPKNLLLS